MPEFTQLDIAKSMMRNLPPKYTGGLCPTIGQLLQAAATATRKNQRNRPCRATEKIASLTFLHPLNKLFETDDICYAKQHLNLITSGTFLPVISVIASHFIGQQHEQRQRRLGRNVMASRVSLVTLEVDAQGRPSVPVPDKRKTTREPSSSRILPCLSLREPSTGST